MDIWIIFCVIVIGRVLIGFIKDRGDNCAYKKDKQKD